MAKRVLITGSTDGIGLETARQLHARGFEVLVHGRNEEKASRTAQMIAGDGSGSPIHAVHADLASFDEVRALGARLRARGEPIHVLINNAGVFVNERQLTVDGHELTFQVNHLSMMLLTYELESLLDAAAPARVVNVSSVAHQRADLDFDDLELERGFSGYRAYARSKLANVLFSRALAGRRPAARYTVNALHPGVISTKLLRTGFGMGGADLASGAKTSVYAATAPELEAVSGRYFSDAREASVSSLAKNDGMASRLFDESLEMLGLAAWD